MRRKICGSHRNLREVTTRTFHYAIFTGIPDIPNYTHPMRYFFHIFDGPKVHPDEGGSSLSSPEIAVRQAKALALELTKAGALCRSNLVLVLDETGSVIFKCWAATMNRAPSEFGKIRVKT
jgi:hypothetical protein